MIHLESFKVSIPLKKKFAISKGEAEVKTNLLTMMNNRYYGEAAGSVYYGPSVEELEADIITGIEKLNKSKEINLGTLEEINGFDISSAARSALMGMVLNFLSGEARRYPWEILSLGSPVGIRSSVTIAIAKPAEMKQAIKDSPYSIIKIKMGNEEDVLVLDVLGQLEGKEIRVDANGGWSCAKAEEMIFHLAGKGVTVIEQPTDIEFIEEWPHLKGKNDQVQIIMDEGLSNLEDYRRYRDYIDGVNIKMEKSGGILEAMKIAAQAREDGKKVMLGCMVASSVGIAQSVYMSSQADYFDLDGPLLLESDIARGILYDRESIAVDREIIGGPKLRRDVLQKYISE
jgi:L-alanine-DL-glutamate epimerase-like enolase superfamily enzyme